MTNKPQQEDTESLRKKFEASVPKFRQSGHSKIACYTDSEYELVYAGWLVAHNQFNDRIEELEERDSEAAQYVEAVICMRTHFSGEPPYVGWKGLGLALTEHLDRMREKINNKNIQETLASITVERQQTMLNATMKRLEKLERVAAQIRQWDMLDIASDGSFWKKQLDDALKPIEDSIATLEKAIAESNEQICKEEFAREYKTKVENINLDSVQWSVWSKCWKITREKLGLEHPVWRYEWERVSETASQMQIKYDELIQISRGQQDAYNGMVKMYHKIEQRNLKLSNMLNLVRGRIHMRTLTTEINEIDELLKIDPENKEAPCHVCSGVTKIGSPGMICPWCHGTGKQKPLP